MATKRRASTTKPIPVATGKGRAALAAGAARASGERARRTRTPLLAASVGDPRAPSNTPDSTQAMPPQTGDPLLVNAPISVAPLAPAIPSAPSASTGRTTRSARPSPTSPGDARAGQEDAGQEDAGDEGADEEGAGLAATKHRPRPEPRRTAPTASAIARSGTRVEPAARPARRPGPASRAAGRAADRTRRTLQAVPDLGVADPVTGPVSSSLASPSTARPGIEDLLQGGVAALRTVISATGIAPAEVEAHVARALAFIRRRLTGDFVVDEFGFDEDATLGVYLPLLRPLYRSWFRVEVRGMENIPAEGGGLVVANHSGTIAMDSLMTQVAVHDEHPAHRHLRMLGADLVFQTPVIGQIARKSGTTLAIGPDAERLLNAGELVGVWPEGFKGVGKPFSERYKLQRFGRGGFVSAAVRAGVPIIPCSIVGAEEIYPIIGNMKTLARLLGAPYAPVTPTWPLLGPLGLIPLPSKWIIEFGVPVETASLGPGAADDPMLVFDLTDQIRETIQQTLYSLLMQRRSVFF
ncbi:MAG: 1-acyl-sn-glycerol-3-phosphate acyltransferase [Lapillicoccus sp.]